MRARSAYTFMPRIVESKTCPSDSRIPLEDIRMNITIPERLVEFNLLFHWAMGKFNYLTFLFQRLLLLYLLSFKNFFCVI